MVPAALPVPSTLHVEALLLGEDGVTILASSEATEAACPLCGERSDRVHSRYTRTLADQPIGECPVTLHRQVRRFRCRTPGARGEPSPSRPGG